MTQRKSKDNRYHVYSSQWGLKFTHELKMAGLSHYIVAPKDSFRQRITSSSYLSNLRPCPSFLKSHSGLRAGSEHAHLITRTKFMEQRSTATPADRKGSADCNSHRAVKPGMQWSVSDVIGWSHQRIDWLAYGTPLANTDCRKTSLVYFGSQLENVSECLRLRVFHFLSCCPQVFFFFFKEIMISAKLKQNISLFI